jgi:hypothetical protein
MFLEEMTLGRVPPDQNLTFNESRKKFQKKEIFSSGNIQNVPNFLQAFLTTVIEPRIPP